VANPTYGKCYPYESVDQQAGETEWRHYGAAWGDGIVNDFSNGAAFSLAKSASSRTMTMTLGEYRIKGILFEPTTDVLSFTPTIPTGGTGAVRRDRIIARLDPATKNITFLLREGVAVTTGVAAGPTLARVSGGAWEYSLHTFAGGNVAADQLDYFDDRNWVAPPVFHFGELLPNAGDFTYGQFLNMNRGTWNEQFVRRSSAGDPAWISLDRANYQPVNIGTTLKGGAEVPQYGVNRGRVQFKGEVGPKTTDWTTGNGKGLGQVPVEVAPPIPRSFPVFLTNISDGVRRMGGVTVNTDGQLTLDLNVPAGVTVGGAKLDSISYDLPGA
jgi:hypothetical protein